MAAAANTILKDGARFTLLDHSGTRRMLVIESKIGEGGMGYVWKGTLEGYGDVAVKRVKKTIYKAKNNFNSEQKVIKTLSVKRNAANVVGCDPFLNCFYGIIENGDTMPESPFIFKSPYISDENYYMIYEYIAGMDLEKFVKAGKPFAFDHVRVIHQLLNAIYHMHSLNIAHLDIKPFNIMIMPDGRLKVIDFGLAQHITKTTTFITGTPEYLPPETFLPKIEPTNLKTIILSKMSSRMLDFKLIDMYAIGCTLYYIFTGKYLVESADKAMHQRYAPTVILPDPYKMYEPLIQKLVSVNNEIMNIYQYMFYLDFKTKEDLEKLGRDENKEIEEKTRIITETQSAIDKLNVATPNYNENKEDLEFKISECIRRINDLKTNKHMRQRVFAYLQHKTNDIGDMRLGKNRYTAEQALHEWCRMHAIPDDACIVPLTAYQRDLLRTRAEVNAAAATGGAGSKGGSYTRRYRKRTTRRYQPRRSTRTFKY